MKNEYQIVVAGSGAVGSITATILSKLGYRVLLLEKGGHPRFVVGESSTPVTALLFERLARKFEIPELSKFSSYEKLKNDSEGLTCGPKQIFYYLYHELDQEVGKFSDLNEEIAVEVPGVEAQYDRSSMDAYLVDLAQSYGVVYFDNTEIRDLDFGDGGVTLDCVASGSEMRFTADFMIDGTGAKSIISEKLDLRVQPDDLDTPLSSRAIFSHFEDVKLIEEVFDDECVNDRLTVKRELSTQHHMFDGGWLWFIPFDNGVTSVGACLDADVHPATGVDAEQEFWDIVNRVPVVSAMMGDASAVRPFHSADRLQYQSTDLAGDRWVLLPHAASFVDPWQSTGLVSSLMGVERIVWALHNMVFELGAFQKSSFDSYEIATKQEFHHITRFVHGIYKSTKHYELFRLMVLMPALSIEEFVIRGGLERPWDKNSLYMNFADPYFKEVFYRFYEQLLEVCNMPDAQEQDYLRLQEYLLKNFERYNTREYGDPAQKNIYMNRERKELEVAVASVLSTAQS